MRRHADRIAYLHLKSVYKHMQQKVGAEKIPFAIAVGMDMFCEPSEGAIDFAAFRDVLREVNYEALLSSSRICIRHPSTNLCRLPREPELTCEKLG